MLANVVSNAIDASNAGEKVTLAAKSGPVLAGCIACGWPTRDVGSRRKILSQIFEPYFTTKNYGDDMRGFAFGLTICQKIAHLHGGTISVDSQLGRGTTMTIELPIDAK